MPDASRPVRSRNDTQARIIGAVGDMLARDGFRALGINALAREAEVDKVLIYRYFGDLRGLIDAYARRGDFWYRAEDIVPPGPPIAPPAVGGFVADIFRRHTNALLVRPQTLEILAWETVERNALTAELETVRESVGLEALAHAASRLPSGHGLDLEAFAALMAAATNYLAVRSRSIKTFNGVDIGSAEGRERLFSIMGQMAQALLGHGALERKTTPQPGATHDD